MKDKEPLKVLQAAREFERQVAEVVRTLRRKVPAPLRMQLLRASQAISALIAEGFGRGTAPEKIRYSWMANGELEESQNYLRQYVNQRLIDRKTFYRLWNLSLVTSRMLRALIKDLKQQKDDK
jgi:four helix bundle protein